MPCLPHVLKPKTRYAQSNVVVDEQLGESLLTARHKLLHGVGEVHGRSVRHAAIPDLALEQRYCHLRAQNAQGLQWRVSQLSPHNLQCYIEAVTGVM